MPCDAANVTYNVIYTVNYIVSYTDEIYLEICTVNYNVNYNANDNVNYTVMNSVNYNSHLQCMLTVDQNSQTSSCKSYLHKGSWHNHFWPLRHFEN